MKGYRFIITKKRMDLITLLTGNTKSSLLQNGAVDPNM